MALKDTTKNLRDLLSHITHDLEKADNGNKAASQRVRTGTVRLEKIAKMYRKESIKGEKGVTKSAKKPAKKSASKSSGQKASAKKASAHKSSSDHGHKSSSNKTASKSKPKTAAKATAHKAKARAFSMKKPTAKLPTRRAHR